MKLITENGELSLPENFNFEIELHHPFLSDDGASSIPTNLPATTENLSILGFPNRIARTRLWDSTFRATLSHGVWHQAGNLVVGSVTDKEGISCVFSSNESILYSTVQEMDLKELFAKKENLTFGTKMTGGNADEALSEAFVSQDTTYLNFDFHGEGLAIFPVAVDDDGFGFKMLNAPKNDNSLDCAAQSRKDSEGNVMKYPHMFGLTPFIRLWKMLDLCFELAGYTVSENVFRDSPYCDIVVLNSCADACVLNKIIWADLVPDMTVGDLIVWLKDKFAAMVCFDGSSVKIRLMEYCLNASPDIDITPYCRSGENVSFPPKRRVILDCAKSLERAAPPLDTSIDKYLQQYDAFTRSNSYRYISNPLVLKPIFGDREGSVGTTNYSTMYLGSSSFRYDRDMCKDTDKRETDDLYIPVDIYSIDVYRPPILAPYIGEPSYRHTKVEEDCEVATEQPLYICWTFWDPAKGYWSGSSQPYDYNGDRISDVHFPLTPDGLYHMFWKSYNKMLLSSAPSIELQLDLPINKLINIDLSIPKLYKGKKVIIESLKFSVSDVGVKCDKCTLITLPIHMQTIDDMDIYDTDSLTWKYIGIPKLRNNNGDIEPTDNLVDYSTPPAYPPTSFGETAMMRVRWGIIKYYTGEEESFYWRECFLAVLKG